MQVDFINRITEVKLFKKVFEVLSSLDKDSNKFFTSPLFGSSKAFLLNELVQKENQVLVLLP
jgi:hypothetical protein